MKLLYTIATGSILKMANAAQKPDFKKIVANPAQSSVSPEDITKAIDALEAPAAVSQQDAIELAGFGRNLFIANCVKIKKKDDDNTTPVNIIDDYGCWCRSAQNLDVPHYGTPVDPVDDACKYYTLGNMCLTRDHPTCDIASIDYSPYVRMSWNGYLTIYCAEEPTPGTAHDQCAADVCKVELQGLSDQMKALTKHGLQDKYKHEKGFEPSKENCFSNGDGPYGPGSPRKTPVLECCGDYPYRVEFDSTLKTCCHKKNVYNDVVQACCDDGSVKPVGTC